MTGWKFLIRSKAGRIVSDYDGSPWVIGEWREHEGMLEECLGFNCSPTIPQALRFVQGTVVAEVEYEGDVVESQMKMTARRMRLLRVWEWGKEDSVRLAIDAAESVIRLNESSYPNDKRPRAAIEAAKRWLEEPSNENRQAAIEAAADAAAWALYAAASGAVDAARAAARAAYAAASGAADAADAAARAAYAADAAAEATYAAYAGARAAAYSAEAASKASYVAIHTKAAERLGKPIEEIHA